MGEDQEKERTLEEASSKPSERARWIAAVGYLAFMCFVSLHWAGRDPFVRYHAKQGFLLFAVECVCLAFALVLGLTVARIRLVGIVAVGLFELVTGLAALALSVAGFFKALSGEYWSIPFLGEYRERVPVFHSEEDDF